MDFPKCIILMVRYSMWHLLIVKIEHEVDEGIFGSHTFAHLELLDTFALCIIFTEAVFIFQLLPANSLKK